ncbi:MAG: NAD(P)/FAD-dependent oxidoreductase, partial [Candidatus Dormibacteraeota bacterium]|nr:NAD(P)/FAD-dependent oxidoreductase [Candidatus Dormibacteraeota bacterium]
AFAGLPVDLVTPRAAMAHPFDDGTAALVEGSVSTTAARLGGDGPAYRRLLRHLVVHATEVIQGAMGPIRVPRRPLLLSRFGIPALLPAALLGGSVFQGREARAILAGMAAHSMLPLTEPGSSAAGLIMLVSAHATGWPFVRGGSATAADTMVRRIEDLGGEVRCGTRVSSVDELPAHRAALLDVMPDALVGMAGGRLAPRYREQLERYRHGPGVFKLDWVLDGPIPWQARECARAGTLHLGGTAEEVAASELEVDQGGHPRHPFVLLTQPSLFDPTRAAPGRQVAWAYCHVPNGSGQDMTAAIEGQVERFAPGFRDRVRARRVWTPAQIEEQNPNCVGGDVGGGRSDLRQLLGRPAARLDPYRTSDPSLFLCSAATPPGPGVHGLCGWYAARSALRSRLA